MAVINVHEAKTHLSRLLERVRAGEEIILGKSGKPIAKIVPYTPQAEPRKPGIAKGKIWIADNFDDPLPEDIMKVFRGEGK
ncbi:MAG: type II toxin-antitoxin system Phd/YefM family antitoxin [Rhodospirillaceae bacterium]|nr:type II toxin-antitoxin system Phd/YefM family antitoxin [Rhodospirillaceae bacterium]